MHLVPPLDSSSPSQRSAPTAPAPAPTFGASESSNAESNELAFLEFVTCSMCHYPLQSDQPRDFWITSCGHILCGGAEHQHKAQHCTHCRKTPIETYLVSNDLPEDLQRWLQPTKLSISSISDTLSILYFQNRELSRLVRFLREENDRRATETQHVAALQRELKDVKRQLAEAHNQAREQDQVPPPSRGYSQQVNHRPYAAPSFGQPPPVPGPGSGSGSDIRRKRLREDQAPPAYPANLSPPPRMASLTTPRLQPQPLPQLQPQPQHRPSTSASVRKLSQYAYRPEGNTRPSSVRPSAAEIRHPRPQRATMQPPPPIRAMPTVPHLPTSTHTVPVKLGALGSGRQTLPLQSTPRATRTMLLPRMNGTPQRFVPGSNGTEGSSYRRASEM